MLITINGIVQGVGFRPFVHKLVKDYNLKGWVKNTSSGVVIEVEGELDKLHLFYQDIQNKRPLLAVIEKIDRQIYDDLALYEDFKIIRSSSQTEKFTLISPDVSICSDCLKELLDKNDRRYRFPFINCTNCGPRFTIIKDVPYDRDKTTMKDFMMCSHCSEEYHDIENRRYHAQPNCCPKCGPEIYYKDLYGNIIYDNVIECVKKDLKNGKIVAIKGIGGFHLACNARDREAVGLLRKRKKQRGKTLCTYG